MPIEFTGTYREILIDNDSTDPASQECPDTVRHHHEEPLGACPDGRIALGFDIDGTGNVKEIKSHPVNKAGEDYHPEQICRIPVSKQTEPKDPSQHAYQHDFLDTESPQEEWDRKNKESFGDL